MEMNDEGRDELRARLREWVLTRQWNAGEVYPFEDMSTILSEWEGILMEWGCQSGGWKRLGETFNLYGMGGGYQFRMHVKGSRVQPEFLFQLVE